MKSQAQGSLLKWASLLARCSIRSIIDIQNTQILVTILNNIQPSAFQELYQIDERASNTMNNILKAISNYYKKQLNCNVSSIIQNLNIFKSPFQLWQLLIGVAIRGKNRDTNINLILQMQMDQQSELMILVQEVMEKLQVYDMDENRSNVQSSDGGSSVRRRNESSYSRGNMQTTQYLNQLINENQILKEKNIQLHNEVSQLKALQEQIKKNGQERISFFKNQRYEFLDILAGNSEDVGVTRKRKQSRFRFRESVASNQSSKMVEDPLHGLNVNLTGTLADIARDLLVSIKNLKKQLLISSQKASIFQDHNKDLKLSINKLIEQNKILKEELTKSQDLQRQIENIQRENQELLANQTQLVRTITEIQQQKSFLRDMVDKLKQQKNEFMSKFNKKQSILVSSIQKSQTNISHKNDQNMLGSNLNPKLNNNVMKMPSMILRQMAGSQLQPQSTNLNEQIDQIKNPAIRQKYQKQISELKQKNNILRQQNNQLKNVNKMLQKTIHKSLERSEQIQKNIQEGYKELFGDNMNQNQLIGKKQESQQKKKKYKNSQIEITLSKDQGNIWNTNKNKIDQNQSEQKQKIQEKQQDPKDNNKIVQFYNQMKKTVQAYEQRQLLMVIEIESLKKQLSDAMMIRQEYDKIKENSQKEKEKSLQVNQNEVKLRERIRQLQNEIEGLKKGNLKKNQVMKVAQVNKKQVQTVQKTQEKPKIHIKQSSNVSLVPQDQDSQISSNSQHKQPSQNNPSSQIKQQSFVMFQINISKPGEQKQNSNKQILQQQQIHQEYKISKNNKQVNNQDKIKIKESQQEYIQIQEGEQLTETEIPVIIYRKSQNSVEENGSVESVENNQRVPLGKQLLKNQTKNNYLNLNTDFYGTHKPNINLISGIDLTNTNNRRKSIFARSGFYNQSFLQLSNKLQSELQNDINSISQNIRQKYSNKSYYNQNYDQNQNEIKRSQLENKMQNKQQNEQLVKKLQKIKSSYKKIKEFHMSNTQKIQEQMNQQIELQKKQIIQLKIQNQKLKQSLTQIIAQKSLTNKKLNQIKLMIEKNGSKMNEQQLVNKFSQIFKDIFELENIMPELERYFDQSKVREMEIMYEKEKYKRQRLEEEIQVMFQTIVYFRNLAIQE